MTCSRKKIYSNSLSVENHILGFFSFFLFSLLPVKVGEDFITNKFKVTWPKYQQTKVNTERLKADGLYEKYADITVDEGMYDIEQTLEILLSVLREAKIEK